MGEPISNVPNVLFVASIANQLQGVLNCMVVARAPITDFVVKLIKKYKQRKNKVNSEEEKSGGDISIILSTRKCVEGEGYARYSLSYRSSESDLATDTISDPAADVVLDPVVDNVPESIVDTISHHHVADPV